MRKKEQPFTSRDSNKKVKKSMRHKKSDESPEKLLSRAKGLAY